MAGANNAAAATTTRRDKKGWREEEKSGFVIPASETFATARSKRFSLINLRSRQRVLRHHPDNRGDRPRPPSYTTCRKDSADVRQSLRFSFRDAI